MRGKSRAEERVLLLLLPAETVAWDLSNMYIWRDNPFSNFLKPQRKTGDGEVHAEDGGRRRSFPRGRLPQLPRRFGLLLLDWGSSISWPCNFNSNLASGQNHNKASGGERQAFEVENGEDKEQQNMAEAEKKVEWEIYKNGESEYDEYSNAFKCYKIINNFKLILEIFLDKATVRFMHQMGGNNWEISPKRPCH
jgi:hypothetical protein